MPAQAEYATLDWALEFAMGEHPIDLDETLSPYITRVLGPDDDWETYFAENWFIDLNE
jgi:hypothetical protein